MPGQWEDTVQTMGCPYVMHSTHEDESAKYFCEKLSYHRIGVFPVFERTEIMRKILVTGGTWDPANGFARTYMEYLDANI